MKKTRINVAIVESSEIIFEGLSNILHRFDKQFNLYRAYNLDEINNLMIRVNIDIAIINPSFIQNKEQEFIKLRKRNPEVFSIALVYTLFDISLLNEFDESIHITDSPDIMLGKISRSYEERRNKSHDQLTRRETDVLVQLVKGLSNKEIADVLNISIHTVISHRKNIIEKTGIKSLPGLTIYAISNNIIPLD